MAPHRTRGNLQTLPGGYQRAFANTFAPVEERAEGSFAGTDRGNSPKIHGTGKLLKKLRNDNNSRVNQRSGLFDRLIGGWDRHNDQ